MQMGNDSWDEDIPSRYHPGELKTGKVTKITKFGFIIELEPGLEGLLHISEMSDEKVERPEDVVKVGDAIQVRVLRVDPANRNIGLSRRQVHRRQDR
jgi:small subunit ribosomal protein S1